MISSITIKNAATFDDSCHKIKNLKELNFFYGSNGSGKTTIGRIIEASEKSDTYPESVTQWKDNMPLRCLVYNKDFISRNFQQINSIPGVITLGEENITIQTEIADLEKSIAVKKAEKIKLLNDVDENEIIQYQQSQLDELNEGYSTTFWRIKQELSNTPLDSYLQGYKNSKKHFFDKVLSESQNNKSKIKKREELIKEKERYEAAKKKRIEPFSSINLEKVKMIEEDKLLQEAIVGKENTTISKLIDTLKNSSWVDQGRSYLEKSEGKCPFCQQILPLDFGKIIENYFDTSYVDNISKLKNIYSSYQKLAEMILLKADNMLSLDIILDKNLLKQKKDEIQKILQYNLELLRNKVSDPGITIEMQDSQQLVEDINNLIMEANREIAKRNLIFGNFDEEVFKSEVWKYIVEFLSSDIRQYRKLYRSLLDNHKKQNSNLKQLNTDLRKLQNDLSDIQSKLTSAKPTVEAINKWLFKYGFNNFHLEMTDDGKNYKIVRNDGTEVEDTLSEGERNFVTFLYFFFLLKGKSVNSDLQIGEDVVVVIDDPVSSMDNNILFVVATLIRSLFGEIIDKKNSRIKQLFVLTHNIYFYHELTNLRGIKQSKKHVSYYIVRKLNGNSNVYYYPDNPVKTSYQILWEQVKICQKNIQKGNYSEVDFIGVPNTLRRIIEYYFKILGALSNEALINNISGDQRLYARSLIMYLNSNSHGNFDETIDIIPDLNTVKQLLSTFRSMFEVTGNISHYNMMMGVVDDEI